MGWDAVKAKPTPPGEWVAWSYGKDMRGWSLDCGGMFHADIGPGEKGYLVTLNMRPLTNGHDIEQLKRVAENAIVQRVRQMLPAYRAIHARLTKDKTIDGE